MASLGVGVSKEMGLCRDGRGRLAYRRSLDIDM